MLTGSGIATDIQNTSVSRPNKIQAIRRNRLQYSYATRDLSIMHAFIANFRSAARIGRANKPVCKQPTVK